MRLAIGVFVLIAALLLAASLLDRRSGASADAQESSLTPPNATKVELDPPPRGPFQGDPLPPRLELARPRTINVKVESERGEALPGIEVMAERGEKTLASSRSNEAGLASFSLCEDEHIDRLVTGESDEYSAAGLELSAADHDRADFLLRLTRRHLVRGVFVGDPAVLAGKKVHVALWRESDIPGTAEGLWRALAKGAEAPVHVDLLVDGAFAIELPVPGSYRCAIGGSGYALRSTPGVSSSDLLKVDGITHFEFNLDKLLAVGVRIFDADTGRDVVQWHSMFPVPGSTGIGFGVDSTLHSYPRRAPSAYLAGVPPFIRSEVGFGTEQLFVLIDPGRRQPPRVRLAARPAGYEPLNVDLDLSPVEAGIVTHDFHLTPAVTGFGLVRVRMTPKSAVAVDLPNLMTGGCFIEIEPTNAAFASTRIVLKRADEEGHFLVEDIPATQYTVRVLGPDGKRLLPNPGSGPLLLEVAPDAVSELDLSELNFGAVEFLLDDPAQRAVQVRFGLRGDSPEKWTPRTYFFTAPPYRLPFDDPGHYRAQILVPGRPTIEFPWIEESELLLGQTYRIGNKDD